MLEEIYKRVGEYKDKYRSDPDILCADQETLEKIIKEIPRLKIHPPANVKTGL